MSLIEGLGDEVTVLFGVVIFVAVLIIAWASTHVGSNHPGNGFWVVDVEESTPTRRVLQVYTYDSPPNTDAVNNPRPTVNNETESNPSSETLTVVANDDVTNTGFESIDPNPSIKPDDGEASPSSSGDRSAEDTSQSPTIEVSEESTELPWEFQIRLKFLDETSRMVGAWLTQTVGDFKQRHFEMDVVQGRSVRLIYNGQLLRDDERSLESYGLNGGQCVMHAHISSVPIGQSASVNSGVQQQPHRRNIGGGSGDHASPPRVNIASPDDGEHFGGAGFNLGQYIWVIFALKLGFLWSGLYFFPHFFDFTSLFTLVIASVIYGAFLYSSWHVRQRQNEQNNVQPAQPQAGVDRSGQ